MPIDFRVKSNEDDLRSAEKTAAQTSLSCLDLRERTMPLYYASGKMRGAGLLADQCRAFYARQTRQPPYLGGCAVLAKRFHDATFQLSRSAASVSVDLLFSRGE